MFKQLSIIALSLLVFSSCSPKVKIGIWAKTHQDAALALGIWSVSNLTESKAILDIDCTDHKQFKKKITDALNTAPAEKTSTENYYLNEARKLLDNRKNQHSDDGFANWCRQYPKAAKKLRSHARAVCKTGLGVLNGTIK